MNYDDINFDDCVQQHYSVEEIAASDLMQRCEDKLDETLRQLNYDGDTVTLVYDLKGRTAGQAWYKAKKIRLNAELLVKNTDRIINQTLPHEIAHLVSYHRYGREGTGHGYLWQAIMDELGLPATRCHNMETTPARTHTSTWWSYKCRCGATVKMSTVRHNRTQGRKKVYTHTTCGYTLRPEDFVNPLDW